VHNVGDVRKIEVHTAEPLVPGLSRLEVETATVELNKYKSPGSDQIPSELTQAGGEILLSAIHKLIIAPVHDKTDSNNYEISPLSTSYKISSSQGQVHAQMKLLGIISVGFDVTDQLLIRFSEFVRY
jgi:hypothetical protein